jgi:transposase
LIRSEIVLGLPDYEITDLEIRNGGIKISARHTGRIVCPHCSSVRRRNKGRYLRRVRHENWGLRHCVLELEACKYQCQQCQRYFRQRFPGIQPRQRSSEAFQRMIFRQHLDGINRSRLARREGIAPATLERCFHRGLRRQFGQFPLVALRSWASMSTSSPAAAATPQPCVICAGIESTMWS